MDLVIGLDLLDGGDGALRKGLQIASSEGGLSIAIVHVVTQQALDQTEKLDARGKQIAAVESAYPLVWRRVERVAPEEELATSSVDVMVRLAPVHLVRSQERIATELLMVARDYGARRIVLGRKGRPGCVAEAVLAHGTLDGEAAGAPFVVNVDPASLALED